VDAVVLVDPLLDAAAVSVVPVAGSAGPVHPSRHTPKNHEKREACMLPLLSDRVVGHGQIVVSRGAVRDAQIRLGGVEERGPGADADGPTLGR